MLQSLVKWTIEHNMSDDEHEQFGFDEDDDIPRSPSGIPWFMQQPWTTIAGFIVVGGLLVAVGSYLNKTTPGQTKKVTSGRRR